MKKLSLLLGTLLCATLVGCNGGKTNDDALVVGLECAYAPFNWTELEENEFTVKIDNNSNINIKYRIVLSIEGELASGLDAKAEFNNEEYSLNSGSTKWFSLQAGADI